MGLISHIKEQHKSKIILVMNEKKVENKDFSIYREKIIDVNLNFISNPKRASELGLSSISKKLPLEDLAFLTDCISALNMINIRIIKHISRILQIIHGHLGSAAVEERQYIISNVVLIVWAYDNEFLNDLLQYDYFAESIKQIENSDEGIDHPPKLPKKLVQSYGFMSANDVHRALATLVQNGYYENSGLDEVIDHRAYNNEKDKHHKEYTKLLWGTMKDNAEDIKDNIVYSIDKFYHDMRLNNFNFYVLLLKAIGYKELASQKIDWFLEKKRETSSAEFFKDFFPNDYGIDGELLAKAKNIQKTFANPPSLASIFNENKELTSEDLMLLKSASVEKLHEVITKNPDNNSTYLNFHRTIGELTRSLSGDEINILRKKMLTIMDMDTDNPNSILHKLRREEAINGRMGKLLYKLAQQA